MQSGLAWCNTCNKVSAQSVCKSYSNLVLIIFQEEDQSILYINMPHYLVEENRDASFSNVG